MVASVPDVKKAGVSLGNIQLRTGQKKEDERDIALTSICLTN